MKTAGTEIEYMSGKAHFELEEEAANILISVTYVSLFEKGTKLQVKSNELLYLVKKVLLVCR